MGRRRKGLEPIFSLAVSVPEYVVTDCLAVMQDYFSEMYEINLSVKEMRETPGVVEYIKQEIHKVLTSFEDFADVHFYPQECDYRKLFAAQIRAHEDQQIKERAAAAAAEVEASAKLLTEGKAIVVSPQAWKQVRSYLMNHGIRYAEK